MAKEYRLSLFIFRRDLRVDDNTALNQALELSEEVLACFIFDPRLADEKRKHFNHNAFQFLLKCLEDLKRQVRTRGGYLFLFSGLPEKIIAGIKEETGIDAVFFNRDYTPFSMKRDDHISTKCSGMGIDVVCCHDALLHEPGAVLTGQGKPYAVFTPFFRKASKTEVQFPATQEGGKFYSGKIGLKQVDISTFSSWDKNDLLFTIGGRSHSLSVLQQLGNFKDYDYERDYPFIKGTTGLSAHNKLGTISIREFYHHVKEELGPGHTLISELYWRDFFINIAIYFPHVFGHAFKRKFDQLSWSDDEGLFNTWCTGQTGFPIVDAGMRELNTTGYMHNRVRMIVASFLVKDLHLDWKWGEQYFASKLVDYDPCVNNGNWQWAASTGADSQPYFRIFNPWTQQRKYDPDCEYIRQWVPELRGMDAAAIHGLERNQPAVSAGYPPAMVDHKTERDRTLAAFGSL
jgi:deoxyribodipyrimidine photo-lyase